jgi:defect-in-organelle-trafficking protein DotC
MTFKKKLLVLAMLPFISFSVLAENETENETETIGTNLSALISLEPQNETKDKESNGLREDSLRDTALSIGSRAGLIRRSVEIAEQLKQFEGNLDKISFGALMIDKNLMPPVITEGKDSVKKDSDDMLKTADAIYRIEIPERLVTTTPSWRDYLYQGLIIKDNGVEKPHDSLLPKTDFEKKVWKKYIEMGYLKGVKQADEIFDINLNRMKRDFSGMARYKILLAQNMITRPVLASTSKAFNGNSKEMSVNEFVYRINEPAGLNPASNTWKPAIKAAN